MSPSSAEDSVRFEGLIRAQRDKFTIDSAIRSPGAVKINFQGAFIVDEESQITLTEVGAQHDTNGIRLPNHKAVVSHVALDASFSGPIHHSNVRLNTCAVDWRLTCEACILLTGIRLEKLRWSIKLLKI